MGWAREHRIDPSEDPARWYTMLKRARIPERHWTATPQQVKGDSRWMAELLTHPSLWADRGYGVFLHGPFNTGKSAAAALLAMDFVKRCHAVLWLAVREVPAVRFREGEYADLDVRLQTADLLVLDDLGSERFKMDGPAGAALEESARIMYDRGRPVIFTSNKSWTSFPMAYAHAPAFVSVVQRLSIPIALVESWPGAPELGK